MAGAGPRFPAFADWAKMTEQEQDALLDRIAISRRRRAWVWWGTGVGALALVAYALLATFA